MRLEHLFQSIAFRMSVSIALIIGMTAIAVGWLILSEEKSALEVDLQNKGRYIAELMSHHIVEPLLYEEHYSIFFLLQGSINSGDSIIVYAEVRDKNGSRIVSAFKNNEWRGLKFPPYQYDGSGKEVSIIEDDVLPVYYIIEPITATGLGTIGFLQVCITKEQMYEKLGAARQKLMVLSAIIILFGILLGLWMARRVLKPVLLLNKGVKMISEGEIGVELPVVGEGEIRELSLSFNRMSAKLKELLDTIQSAQDHLIRKEKLYAIGEFSAGVAHEIKNPFTAIKMLIQTAQQKNHALTEQDFSIIDGEINRIDTIIRTFLAFARPEKTEMTSVDINEVVNEVITITKPQMERSSISVEENFSPDMPMIRGSHDSLKQGILNIVLNAIQAMNSKGGLIRIETERKGNNISVTVCDNGSGISQENLQKIFDPFFTTKEEGTGLGLSLTHNIIHDHAGTIEVDSFPGNGTTVRINLPV